MAHSRRKAERFFSKGLAFFRSSNFAPGAMILELFDDLKVLLYCPQLVACAVAPWIVRRCSVALFVLLLTAPSLFCDLAETQWLFILGSKRSYQRA